MFDLALVLDDDMADTLSAIKKRLGLRSDARAIRYALVLLDVASEAEIDGERVIMDYGDGSREIIRITPYG